MVQALRTNTQRGNDEGSATAKGQKNLLSLQRRNTAPERDPGVCFPSARATKCLLGKASSRSLHHPPRELPGCGGSENQGRATDAGKTLKKRLLHECQTHGYQPRLVIYRCIGCFPVANWGTATKILYGFFPKTTT